MKFRIDKIHGTFTFIPTIVWEYAYDELYIQFLFWDFGIYW